MNNNYSNKMYDAIVIGSGSGGLTAAVGLSRFGKRVLMLERSRVGGDCTNVGCVPSKALLHAAATGIADPFEHVRAKRDDLAEREGRAVVVAVNKWDLEEDRQAKLKGLKEAFERLLPQLRGAPLVTVSAKTGRGLDRLQAAVVKAHDVWNRRVPTAALNRWLGDMVEAHPPPAPQGRRIKLRYMTQAKTRPPTFVAFCSRPEEVPAAYRRYLVNGLRESFELQGTPLRLFLRKRENPFADRASSR